MATTANYALRYPVLTDAPNGPQAFQNLANDVDAQLLITNNNTRVPVCIMTCGAATSIATSGSVFTTVAFSTEQIDTVSGHDTATNNSRYTCQSGWAGYYQCSASILLGPQTPGGSSRAIKLKKNGTEIDYTESYYDIVAYQSSLIVSPTIIQLAVNDYIEVGVLQNGTGAVNTIPQFCMMNINFLRPL